MTTNLMRSLVGLCTRRYTTLALEGKGEPDGIYKSLELEMRALDREVLKSYSKFLMLSAKELDIDVGNCFVPKKAHHERLTLLRSIHVNKKCRVQYEARTYFTILTLGQTTGSTCQTYLEYVQRNLPQGISMKVTKVKLEEMPRHISKDNVAL